MQKLYRNIALLAIMSLLYSCKRTIDAGIKTNVSGIVFDYSSQQPIANVPIYIYEYVKGPILYPPLYKATIDSTKSGADGKYSISFSTTGEGSEYRIGSNLTKDYYSLQDPVALKVGDEETVNFYAWKLHVLKARLQVTENPNPPMRVTTIDGLQARVWGTNNDTVVFMKIIPNHVNQIQYLITNVDTPTIYNYRIDTINFSGFQDTFNLTIPVVPKTFPKRG